MRKENPISRIEMRRSLLHFLSICIWICLFAAVICVGAESPAPIPADEITALEAELAQGAQEDSPVQVRIACKRVIRRGEQLLEAAPEAPNRFAVLDIMFSGARRLLSVSPTEESREELFAVAKQLQAAPDEYAESRFEADMMLSERDLATANASTADRVKALKVILEKYRGTEAERRSLEIGSMIAQKLQAFELHEEIEERMAGGSLARDHKSIVLRRKRQSLWMQNVVFSGTYKSSEGATMTFPADRLGHQYVLVLWSKGSAACETFLSSVREQQERFPGRFEVYSLNLDELPDAGSSILKKAGVQATALHLPGGRSSSAAEAYAAMDPVALLVNGQGYMLLEKGKALAWPGPTPARGKNPAKQGPGVGLLLDDARYLAQLRSLFIGDWLLESDEWPASAEAMADKRGASGPPPPRLWRTSEGRGSPELGEDQQPTANIEQPTSKEGEAVVSPITPELQAIRDCFVAPPYRYRLTPEDELANYQKAEQLCVAAIKKAPKADSLWIVRNCRIVALMGMWNLALEPKYLAEAVEESKALLSTELPAGKDLAARFCLAREKLRGGVMDAEALLEELAGDKPSAAALAAAAVLAIEMSAEDLYYAYRRRFLSSCNEEDSSLWQPLSFMRDRQHDYKLFWPNPGRWGYTMKQRYNAKYVISGFLGPSETGRLFQAEFSGLDGKDLSFPQDTKGAMAGVVFAELPGDASERSALMERVKQYAAQFSSNGVPVTVAFLSEDVNKVKEAVDQSSDLYRPAIVPMGLKNPLVRRLGILSADRIPNPYLIGGDGTIIWSISGLTYPIEYPDENPPTVEDSISMSIGIRIEKVRTDRAFEALEKGDFKKALALINERLPPKMEADPWTHDRLHGRALAHMGLKDWPAALVDIDAAITRRSEGSRYGKTVDPGMAQEHMVKAVVLKKLGRDKEAAKEDAYVRKLLKWLEDDPYFTPPSYARNGIPVGVYDELLKRVRLGLEEFE